MAGKRNSQRSTRNQKPKYTSEESEASVEISPSSSYSMETVAAKQVDIILKKSGTELIAATSTSEKAVAPAAEKSVRTIAINLTLSEDQIRTWLDVPETEKPKKETKKRAPRSTPKARIAPKTSSTPKAKTRRAGRHTLTEKRKEFVVAKMTRVLSGAKAAEFGSAESIQKLAKNLLVPVGHMRKWLGITDDLSQIIANSNLKVRGFESKTETSEEKEAEVETVPLDGGNPDKMVETENDADLPDELVGNDEIAERRDELLEVEVQRGNESPEEMEVPKDNDKSLEEMAEVPEVNQCPEELVEAAPEDDDCSEEMVEIPKEVMGMIDELMEALEELEEDQEKSEKVPVDKCPDKLMEVPKEVMGMIDELMEALEELEEDQEKSEKVPVDKCPDKLMEVPKENCSPEEMAEALKAIEGPEEIAEIPKVIEGPEEIAEIPRVIEGSEQIEEEPNEVEGPQEGPQPAATRPSPILPIIDGETVKLVAYESLDDDDEPSPSIGEIEMSSDKLEDGSSSAEYESAEEETCELEPIRTKKIGDGENENPLEKKGTVVAEPKDISQQQEKSSSLADCQSDEMDTGNVSPKDAEDEKTPTPAKRKTCIDDYFPKLKNKRMA